MLFLSFIPLWQLNSIVKQIKKITVFPNFVFFGFLTVYKTNLKNLNTWKWGFENCYSIRKERKVL